MAEKKYYWLKLKEDFFEEDTIAWLEEQENGKEYALFYLKLCLKSLKSNGYLIRNVGQMLVPYDIKKLAEITKTKFDTALAAMELLKAIGLVEVMDDGKIFLTQLNSMVGSGSASRNAIKQRAYRARKALENRGETDIIDIEQLPEPSDTSVTPPVTKRYRPVTEDGNALVTDCPTEIEIRDRDKEIEKEIEIETEKGQKKSIDYLAIVNAYKEICISLPSVRALSENRKKAIRARLNSGYTQEDFIMLFQKAQQSDFLKGKNDRNWNADFDWLIKDANMAKVLEGKYDNRPNSRPTNTGSDQNDGVTDWLHKYDL